jgi:uridine kinase
LAKRGAPVYGIAGQVGSGRTDVALRLTIPEDLRDPFATVIERR